MKDGSLRRYFSFTESYILMRHDPIFDLIRLIKKIGLIISDKFVRNRNFRYLCKNKEKMFSKACEYGIKATLYIAKKSLSGERVSLKEIAKEIASPEAFTAKILQQLSRSKIIRSTKGPVGGFDIDKVQMDAINLSEIVTTIDGDKIYKGCGLGLEHCNENKPCPLHDKFAKVRDDLKEMLENTSLYELATGLDIGLTYLKR